MKSKMPNRGKKGWCGCLQDDEPPEITYCMVDNAGTLAQVTFTPTLPIPPTNELNTMFEELVEELDLTAPNKAAMLSLPDEKKWQIYCSRKMDQTNGSTTDAPDNPEQYIEQLRNFKSSPLTENDDTEIKSRTRILDSLRTALRTQPHSFVLRFIECEGLLTLLEYLKKLDHYSGQTSLHCSIIGCIKALMNNSTGRSHVLGYPGAIDIIAQSLSTENIKTKIAVLEILGAVCLIPGGHKKVLDAMSHYQRFCNERSRFQEQSLPRSTSRLQRAQNTCVRYIYRARKRDFVPPYYNRPRLLRIEPRR
uniref:Disheveled-associated activator of morphogenesis 1 n=1 Tax=Cacopsylla melanoneura TaxID=428564 RepID=A0A8D8QX99_9HEMI